MNRIVTLTVGFALALAVLPVGARQAALQSPAPQIQNGRVDVRPGAAIDREIAAASPKSSTEPVWIGWRVPMVPGDRDMCGWYSDRLGTVRGTWIDDGITLDSGRPQIKQPTGPIPLEAGTGLVVIARVVGGSVERLRTTADDCPMDAGGRTVIWLSNITPAESLRFLATLAGPATTDRSMFDLERQTATTAVRAIGLHADAAATGALETIATKHPDGSVRHQATSSLGAYRGAAGVAALSKLLAATTAGSTRDSDERRSLITAFGQSREPSAVDALRGLAKDQDAKVRSEAWYYVVLRGGTSTIPDALKVVAADPDESVRKRVVTAIGRLPGDAGLTTLLQLARATDNPVARKEAISVLSTSKDPRAIALMDEILKR
jgi:hypothetical protein